MTQEEFVGRLALLRPRDAYTVDYSTFEQIFFRVAEDDSALTRCEILAKTHGCTVVHDRPNQLFRFIRVA